MNLGKKMTSKSENQRTNDQGHSRVWARNNTLLDLNEVDDKCKSEDGCHVESQV